MATTNAGGRRGTRSTTDLQAMGGERGLPGGPYRQAARRHGGDPTIQDLAWGLAFFGFLAGAFRWALGEIPGLPIWRTAWLVAVAAYGMGYLSRRSYHQQRRNQEEP